MEGRLPLRKQRNRDGYEQATVPPREPGQAFQPKQRSHSVFSFFFSNRKPEASERPPNYALSKIPLLENLSSKLDYDMSFLSQEQTEQQLFFFSTKAPTLENFLQQKCPTPLLKKKKGFL